MKLAIFGTGKVYDRCKHWLKDCDVVALFDNSVDKQGLILDGVKIAEPTKICDYEYDYVIIMAAKYNDIVQQLLGLGIAGSKIVIYNQIGKIVNIPIIVNCNGIKINIEDWIKKKEKQKKVFLVSHDLGYSGVPVAVMNMTVVFKKMGYAVLMAGIRGGAFVQELKKNDIDYIETIEISYGTVEFSAMLKLFDLVVAGTFAVYDFVMACQNSAVPMLWWLHETEDVYYKGKEKMKIQSNVNVYGVSTSVINTFKKYYPHINISMIRYCLPEIVIAKQQDGKEITFCVIGTICNRKAQDLVCKAIANMPLGYRNRFRLVIVGKVLESEKQYGAEVLQKMQHFSEIQWMEQLNQEQIRDLYDRIDVLLCVSRDDPMPIVVTEAMQHKKLCVVSDRIGQCEYITSGINGFVIGNEDIDSLTRIMEWCIDNPREVRDMGIKCEYVYKDNFSPSVMESRLTEIVADICN